MTSAAVSKEQLIELVRRLEAGLQSLPASEPIGRAIYHCERLRLAIASSHSEGTRFAAFTINKLLRDHRASLGGEVAGALDELTAKLREADVPLDK